MAFVGAIQAMVSRLGPYFTKGPNIGRFLESVAVTLDSEASELQQGLKLSQPLNCDSSALPTISRDRTIRLYQAEPESSQRIRLASWLQFHRQRGTHIGELRHSQPYFLPDTPIMRIVHQDGAGNRATWHTLQSDGTYEIVKRSPSNWNYDGQTSHWSRFWVITYAPSAILNRRLYDDGCAYDDGTTWDGVLAKVARDLVDMILEWKAPTSSLGGYILATDPSSFDPNADSVTSADGWTSLPVGNWGRPWSPPPVSIRTRPPTAIWIYEGVL